MVDPALARIRQQPRERLTLDWLRRSFKKNDPVVWASLDSGRAVLASVAQLDQYLWAECLMINAQWRCVMASQPELGQPARLIDYGCGQGIAGLLVNELTLGTALAQVNEAVLIEPSRIALARAEAVYRNLCPAADVLLVPKFFGDVGSADVGPAVPGSTLHLFSNTLDVEGYDPRPLLSQTLREGRHTILAVSHHREHHGGTPQFRTVKAAFEDPGRIDDITIRRSILEQFRCTNGGRWWDAVAWLCEFEVHSG